jgi:hypothetical protein
VEAVVERHPGLAVEEVAPRRVTIGGEVGGRAVRLTLKIAAREGDDERYVVRVALQRERPIGPIALADLDPRLARLVARKGATVTRDDHQWLRVGFRVLGKVDLLDAVDALGAAAAGLDAG